jgi:hypothetical protein
MPQVASVGLTENRYEAGVYAPWSIRKDHESVNVAVHAQVPACIRCHKSGTAQFRIAITNSLIS